MSRNHIPLIWQACNILLKYLVNKLSQQQVPSTESTCVTLTTKQLLLSIRALCSGQYLLTSNEETALIAILKHAKIPSCTKSQSQKKSPPQPIKDSKRARCDLSTNILEQLTMPLQDFSSLSIINENTSEVTNRNTNESGNVDPHSDRKVCMLTVHTIIVYALFHKTNKQL